MELITDLPRTGSEEDTILVVVDRFTKMAHFVPTSKTCNAKEIARLFLARVVGLHGVPKELVADRDPRFTSEVWSEFCDILGIQHAKSTAFHPQSDGQTERMNRILQDYLRRYVGGLVSSWSDLLPMAELAINSAVQESTKYSPFFLNYGRHPRHPFELAEAFGQGGRPLEVGDRLAGSAPAVNAFAGHLAKTWKDARQHLLAAQDRQKALADGKRTDLTLQIGQQVLLSTKNLMTRVVGGHKMLPRWVGPFTVLECIGEVAYRLDLPGTMRCHTVFHISLLKVYKPSGRVQPPPPLLFEDGQLEFEVQRILDHRTRQVRPNGAGRITEYLIRWAGYSADYDSWEPQTNLSNCQDLVAAYEDYALQAQERNLR